MFDPSPVHGTASPAQAGQDGAPARGPIAVLQAG